MAKRHHRGRPTTSGQPLPREFLAALAQIPAPLRPAASHLFQTQPACLLCQAEFYAVGAFVSPPPQVQGRSVAGWRHAVVFGLCRVCVALPDRPARVKAALEQDRAREHARWN